MRDFFERFSRRLVQFGGAETNRNYSSNHLIFRNAEDFFNLISVP